MDIGRTLPADVTQSVLLDDLVAFKALSEALFAISGDAIVHIDQQGVIARWNASTEALLGISDERAIGSDARTIIGDGVTAIFNTPNDGLSHPLRLMTNPTGRAPLPLSAVVVALQHGDRRDGWLVTLAPHRRYEEIEQLKNELIGGVSHEFKTPLATIKAYAATLRSDARLDPQEQAEYLSIIEGQADRLERFVDDILLVSRVNAAQLLKRRVSVAFDDILDRALAAVAQRISHRVERDTAGVTLNGDPERLVDIFLHVLDNAFKFSPAGGLVKITAEEREGNSIVHIRDEGIGIAEEHVPFIFDRFYRVEQSLTAPSGGSGLGLFIVHSLVRAHGGTIGLHSEPGNGTTFSITLPVRS